METPVETTEIEKAPESAVNLVAIEKAREDPEANPDPSGQEAAVKAPEAPAEPEEKISEAAPSAPAESADLPEESGDPEVEQKGAAEEGEKKEQPKETRRDRRINRLTREKREAEERATTAEAKLQQQSAAQPVEEPGKALADKKPKQDDFDDFDKYLDARDAYNKKEWQVERDQEAEQATALKANEVRADRWAKGTDQLKADNSDYAEIVEQSDFEVTRAMHDALMASEQGAAVFFHLCKNQDQADKIAAMEPVAATLAIGKLASTIATPAAPAAPSESKKQTKPVSRAPAPGKRVGAGPTEKPNPVDLPPGADLRAHEKDRLAGGSYSEL